MWALRTVGTAAKSKVAKVLPCGRPDFGHMAGDAPGGALGQFVLAQRGEEAGRCPSPRGRRVAPKSCQMPADRRQAQRAQHQRQLGGVDVASCGVSRAGIRSSAS